MQHDNIYVYYIYIYIYSYLNFAMRTFMLWLINSWSFDDMALILMCKF